MPGADAGVVVVLNGASSAGKSTVAAAVRGLWRRPLQVSGIDTFLACQAESFFGVDGVEAPGFSWRPTIVEGLPAYLIQPGPLGQGLVRAAHRYWRACADEGLGRVSGVMTASR
jgi:chloramphenicol 3-O-phosphotransferase